MPAACRQVISSWDGSSWSSVGSDVFNSSIDVLAYGNGILYAGGLFTAINEGSECKKFLFLTSHNGMAYFGVHWAAVPMVGYQLWQSFLNGTQSMACTLVPLGSLRYRRSEIRFM